MSMFSSLFMFIYIVIVIQTVLPVKWSKRFIFALIGGIAALCILAYFSSLEQEYPFVTSGLIVIYTILAPLIIFPRRAKGQILYFATLTLGGILAITRSALWIAEIAKLNVQTFGFVINFAILSFYVIAAKKGLLYKICQSISLLHKNMKAIVLTATWIGTFSILFFSFLADTYADLFGFTLLGFIIIVLFLLVYFVCSITFFDSFLKAHYKNRNDMLDKQIQSQVMHYEAQAEMNKNIRRFQHDYNNLHLGLNSLLKRKDIQGALSFLKSDEMSLNNVPSLYETGSLLLDALLYEKQYVADKANASIIFDGSLSGNLLNTSDICIIFGNALDNAIEACEKLPGEEKKDITVKSNESRGFLFISVKNSVPKDVEIKNNKVDTTKKDKHSHGIGLHSIQLIVKKYAGTMKLSCTNHIFCIEIDLDFNQPYIMEHD